MTTDEKREKLISHIKANDKRYDKLFNSEKLLKEFNEKWAGVCIANMPQSFKAGFAKLLEKIDTTLNS